MVFDLVCHEQLALQPILTDVAAYGETVEKTRALGSSLKEESEEEEREKIDRRLEALSLQFAELQNAADERMRGIYYTVFKYIA